MPESWTLAEWAALAGWFVALAAGIAVLVGNRRAARLRDAIRQLQREQEAVLALIDKLGERITTRIDFEETLRIIAEYIVQATRAQAGAIFLVRPTDQGGALEAKVVHGPFPDALIHNEAPDEAEAAAEATPMGQSIIGRVAEQGEPMLIADAGADPRMPRRAALLGGVRSLILCPLRVRGRVLGVFVLVNKLSAPAFDSRDLALLQALADQAAITVDLVSLYEVLARQQRMEQELAVTREFQKMLLPATFPALPGYDLYASSTAAMVVGGDYFDCFEVAPGHWGLAVADVSGKGMPGALVMAMTRAVLRAEARGCLSPRLALARVNDRLRADTKDTVFVTMIYGILDVQRRVLRFVRAGHEPLLWRRPRAEEGAGTASVEALAPDGMALGMVDGETFGCLREHEILLQPGDAVILYTDGVIEAMDQSGREYGRARLIECIRRAPGGDARALVQAALEDVERFTLGLPQHDDMTLMALVTTAPPPGEEAAAALMTRSDP